MKVSNNPKTITVTQTNFAKAIGVPVSRIQQLVKDGVVIKDKDNQRGMVYLVESLCNYEEMQSNANNEPVNYMEEKAKHEAAQRKIAELKLAKMEKRVFDARTVELVTVENLSTVRARLLGLPSKLAPMLEDKDENEIRETLTAEIKEIAGEILDYSPELFTNEEIDDKKTVGKNNYKIFVLFLY